MKKFEKIYLVGNGRVADDCLKELYSRKVHVTYIEIFREKFSFTKKLCERLQMEFLHIDKNDVKKFLLEIDTETLIISAHNSYIFPSEVVRKKNITIINLHIAYLPQYRGMNPSTWAIFNDESYAGATWHEVGDGIDNGRIIVQRKVPIMEDDTAMRLMLRCFQTGINLFKENLDSFLQKSYHAFLPEGPDTKLFLAKELPNQGMLDKKWGVDRAYVFLRSMDYSGADLMPLPRIELNGKIYEITRYKKELADVVENAEKEANQIIIRDRIGNVLKPCERYCLICWLRELEI